MHVKHAPAAGAPSADALYERVPVFCLPQAGLEAVIATPCNSCFDYGNALADLVVGYMAAPLEAGSRMTSSEQYLVVRNPNGEKLLGLLGDRVALAALPSAGDRGPLVPGIVEQDCDGLLGGGTPRLWSMPRWLGGLLARVLSRVGPSGVEFAKSSIDYHALRNLVRVRVAEGEAAAARSVPAHVRAIDRAYPGLTDRLVEKYRRAREREPRLAARPPPVRREV